MQLFVPPKLTGRYLGRVLESGWYTTGAACDVLRQRLAEFLMVDDPDRIVLASSATAGWQAVLDMIVEKRSSCHMTSVAITAATFPGMTSVVENTKYAGFDCVAHADVIVKTDIGGRRLCKSDEKFEADILNRRVTAYVVADRCHSWLVDEDADFSLFSMYPTKFVPAAEGGVVVCKNKEDAERLRPHLYVGLAPGRAGSADVPSCPGRKANLTDVAAALAIEALELAPAYIAGIRETWNKMAEAADAENLPYRAQPFRAYLFQLSLPADRQVPDVMKRFADFGVPTAWSFRPAPLVTLPCYPGMTDVEILGVMSAAKRVLK